MSKWSIRLLLWTVCMMNHRAQWAFFFTFLHYIAAADCQYDDSWAICLSGTVNPGYVKMVHWNLVVDCLYDDPEGTVSFLGQNGSSKRCCGLFVWWDVGFSSSGEAFCFVLWGSPSALLQEMGRTKPHNLLFPLQVKLIIFLIAKHSCKYL